MHQHTGLTHLSPNQLDHGRPARLATWGALALLTAWLISPMFASQHLEGYTANLKAIAYMANRGDVRGQDLLMPAVTDFLYFSRAGVVALLQLGERLFGPEGDWDFRTLMIMSLAVVLAGSVFIAHRLEGVRPIAAFAALLLIPTVTENAFFFNDNMPSAAFAIAGVALVVTWDRPIAYAGAGLLSAAAVLCRTDAVLLAPLIAGVAWLRHPAWWPWLYRSGNAFLGFAAGLSLGALLLEATPLDAVLASQRFVGSFRFSTIILIIGLSLGVGGVLLLPIGLLTSWERLTTAPDRWRRAAVLILYPALIMAVAFRLGTETRYIYPLLTPWFALYGGRGLETLILALSSPRRRAAQAGVAALALAVLLPPVAVRMRDGPRSPSGRLWMPVLWWQWENAMAGSLRRVEATIRSAENIPLTLLISTHFNDDFFLKQRLLAAGWSPRPAEKAFPGCSGFSVYRKHDSTVAHVRTEPQYALLPTSTTRMRAFLLDRSLSCPALRAADRTVLTTWGFDYRLWDSTHSFDPHLVGSVMPMLQPLASLSVRLTPADARRMPPWTPRSADETIGKRQLQGIYHARDLSPQVTNQLAEDASAYLREPLKLQSAPGSVDSFITWPDFVKAYGPSCADPKRSNWQQIPLCQSGQVFSGSPARP